MVRSKLRVGQVRMIEATFAAILMVIAFELGFFMFLSYERPLIQEAVDLNVLAHNTLHRLAESGIIETSINVRKSSLLMEALQNMLPYNVYFNLTVYVWNTSVDDWVIVDYEGKTYITNAPSGVFEAADEIASAYITLASFDGNIYRVLLVLTRAGMK